MEIPFVGGAYTARSSNLNAQTCINYFPVVNKQDAKNVVALYGTPGLTAFSRIESGVGLVVRAIHVVNDTVYVVINSRVYSISTLGEYTLLGTITTDFGYVGIDDNGTQVIIVDGTTTGYIITIASNTMAAIADGDFPAASTVTFQDGFFVVTETATRKVYSSALYDGTSWDAADFATVEGRSSTLMRTFSNTIDLWMFSDRHIEVYYNAALAAFPFQRIQGALLDTGCGATASVTKINGQVYWLSNKRQVCRNSGYQIEFISTPDIDYQLSTYESVSDAIGFTHIVDGHHFYVITFPSADKTWVFDTITGYWHEWQSYSSTVNLWGRHRANCCAWFSGSCIVGDYSNGTLYKLDMSSYTDDGNAIRRQRATTSLHKERKNLIYHNLEIEFESGVGLSGGVQGEDPQAVLDWSDDGGKTWSNQHWKSIGKIGEHKNRAIWRRLGQSINRVFRVTMSDPVKSVIIGAYAEVEECR